MTPTLGTGQPDVASEMPRLTALEAAWQGIALFGLVMVILAGFVVLGPIMWLDGRLRDRRG